MAEESKNSAMEVEIEKKKCTEIEKANENVNNYRGWRAMPYVIGNETFEKLGAVGTLANLLIYLTTVFHLDNVTAATFILVFSGTCNIGTLVGAFLSDTFFGRYKTLGFATCTTFLGLLAVLLTAAIPMLHPPACGDSSTCKSPTPGQLTFLFSVFGFMVIGASGIRPCNFAFGADQFDPKTASGRRGIDSFLNWYFFTYTFAQMVSLTIIVYIQSEVSWAIGFAVTAILMLMACIVYFMGSKIYVKVKATGSPFTSVAQVIVASIRKRKLKPPHEKPLFNYIPPNTINSKLAYTEQFRFLDKAAVLTPEDQINPDRSAANPWTLCSMQQVEEVKLLLRVLPVWVSAMLFLIPIAQIHTYAIFQALQSDRRILGTIDFKIPAATYIVFEMLGLTIFIPIYDRIAVPLLRKITKKESGITILQRIGVGIFLTTVSMLVSGVVEERRRTIALTKPTLGTEPRRGEVSSMSGLWLIPQLAIVGIAEGCGSIGQVEFFYKQFPENMRSIGVSLFFCGLAASSYLSTFFIRVVHRMTENAVDGNWLPQDLNKGRLDYFYYLITGLETLNFLYFLVVSKWYKYKETDQGTNQVLNGVEQV
ncbi:hypothetical protein ACFE04_018987 [Oxalis oulophora]